MSTHAKFSPSQNILCVALIEYCCVFKHILASAAVSKSNRSAHKDGFIASDNLSNKPSILFDCCSIQIFEQAGKFIVFYYSKHKPSTVPVTTKCIIMPQL